MGEILGLGVTHYPPLIGTDENMAGILRTVLKDPGLPDRYREPASWPADMRREYGDDGGTGLLAGALARRAHQRLRVHAGGELVDVGGELGLLALDLLGDDVGLARGHDVRGVVAGLLARAHGR